MGIWSRSLLILRVKSRAALERVEDPRQVMGYVDEQQQELLRRVKQGLIEVAISKRQLQQQVQSLEDRAPELEDQARRALVAGREDLAKLALDRKHNALGELETLRAHVNEVTTEEQRLQLAEQELAERIERFRMHRKTLSARFTAAEAQVRVKEAMSGVSKDYSELTLAMGRAEGKMEHMLAHASALDALIETGTLELPVGNGDRIERELQEIDRRHATEKELARLKDGMESPELLERN